MNLLIMKTPTKPVFDETVKKVLMKHGYIREEKEPLDISLPAFNLDKNVMIVVMVMIIMLLVTVLIIQAKKSYKRKKQIKEIMGVKIEENTTPYSLKNKANVHEERGEFRYAIRFNYIALLFLMHESNVLYLDETQTNKEIIQYLMKNGFNLVPQISFLMEYFNHYWYGHKKCDMDSYQQWKNVLEMLWNEIQSGKNKTSKNTVFSTCLILAIVLFTTACSGSSGPYSVKDKGPFGLSVFYITLKELDYPVKRSLKPIENHGHNTVQIVADNNYLDINNEKIQEWVKEGGIIVFLKDSTSENILYGEIKEELIGEVYSYGKGYIIVNDVSVVINGMLTESTEEAYNLLKQIDQFSYEKIYFNEEHFYSKNETQNEDKTEEDNELPDLNTESLWKYLPASVKMIIFQLILVMMAYFYFKGKRFGKIIPLYEEVERSENEYLYSVAYLYKKAKCMDIILEIYYKSFIRKIPMAWHDDWLKYWEEEGLASYSQAKKIYHLMNNQERNLNRKELISYINTIEKLKKVLDKRRDLYWKTLKSDL